MLSIKKCLYLFTLFCLSLCLFFIIAHFYYSPFLLDINQWIQNLLYDAFGSIGLYVFIGLTYIGSVYIALPLTIVLVLYTALRKQYVIALLLIYNFASVRYFNHLLKDHYQVARPTLHHLVHVGSYSFPSGHSMDSIAFFGFLAFLLSQSIKKRGSTTTPAWVISSLLILFIGLSRIYLGVHFPVDVFGGFLAGFASLMLTLIFYTLLSKSNVSASKR